MGEWILNPPCVIAPLVLVLLGIAFMLGLYVGWQSRDRKSVV